VKCPKVISDVWEALLAAVLLDGGWSAVRSTITRVLAPFITFFCINKDTIQSNIMGVLANYIVV
jgi:dsRNA-specific ribonuclease